MGDRIQRWGNPERVDMEDGRKEGIGKSGPREAGQQPLGVAPLILAPLPLAPSRGPQLSLPWPHTLQPRPGVQVLSSDPV